MSIRIETLARQTESEYKYSKNQTIGVKEAGVDIGSDNQGGGGGALIDDTTASTETTYSSSKIEELVDILDDTTSSTTTTYSSAKIDELIAAIPAGGNPGTFSNISTTVTVTQQEG